MIATEVRRHVHEVALRRALEGGEIIAYYQPQVETESGRILSVEALSRWRHPNLGIVLPGSFIPLAENAGLIDDLGQIMLAHGCRCAATWFQHGVPLEVSVNVSANQLRTQRFVDRLRELIAAYAFPRDQLTIEITETQLIDDLPAVVGRLDALRDLGVGVSIDDFGIGHSNISRLGELPVSEVKIDQSIIRNPSSPSAAMISAVVALSERRGFRVVAEGVETAPQLARARTLGCHRAQGFFFARPMPEEDVEGHLRNSLAQ